MKRRVWIACVALLGWQFAAAQDLLKVWTLGECLDYALENNIQLRQSRNDYLSGIEDTEEAKAALFPSLTAVALLGREWNVDELAAKFVAAVLVVIGNYIFSKLFVFRKKKENAGENGKQNPG